MKPHAISPTRESGRARPPRRWGRWPGPRAALPVLSDGAPGARPCHQAATTPASTRGQAATWAQRRPRGERVKGSGRATSGSRDGARVSAREALHPARRRGTPVGGMCCPPSAENQATAAGLWTLPGDPDEGRAAHHSAEPAPAPPGPVSDAESPGHTATAGQSWRLGPRSWALLVTTVHRRQDRRSREAQQRGGGHELAEGPGEMSGSSIINGDRAGEY